MTLRSHHRRIGLALGVTVILALALWAIRPFDRLDNLLTDGLLARGGVKSSPTYLVVEITQEDMVRLEHVSGQRQAMADVINAARRGGADRVLLDFILSGDEATAGDRALDSALRSFKPGQIAIASNTRQDLARPPGLYRNLTEVEAALLPGRDGRYRAVASPRGYEAGNPALWLATGRRAAVKTPIDLRIAPTSITPISLADARSPGFAPRFKGKRVVLSLEKAASRSRLALPGYGLTDRGRAFAIAAQSIDDGILAKSARFRILVAAFALMAIPAGFLLGFAARTARQILIAGPAAVLAFSIAGVLSTLILGQAIPPVSLASIALLAMLVAVTLRLNLLGLVKTFLSGDLSPEEAWLWRSQEHLETPVLLLGAGDSIKRANAAAVRAFSLTRRARDWAGAEIASFCTMALALGPSNRPQKAMGDVVWRLEWRHRDVPLAVFTDVTDQAVELNDLEKRLITDPMTGLRNRLGFDKALKEVRLDKGEQCGVFFLDLNGFKQVNDTYGHAIGDELLKVAAKRFSAVTRSQDIVARLGGDEFVILTRGDINTLKAIRTVDNLEASLDEAVRLDGLVLKIGVAVGFALSTPDDTDVMSVVQRADHDMYERKRLLKASRGPGIRIEDTMAFGSRR